MVVTCKICAKEFNRKPSQVKVNNYCSTTCSGESNKKGKYVACKTCGKEVWRTPKEIKDSKTGNLFCSHSCSATFSNVERSENFYIYRKIALSNLPNVCDICGYDEIVDVLQVHHINRDRRNCKLDNLQILCPTCHSVEHFNKKDGSFWNLKNED